MKKIFLAGAALAALTVGAQAADLGSRRTPIASTAYAPVMSSWNAIYGGINVGGAFGSRVFANAFNTDFGFNSGSGFIVGGQIGADFQSGAWVFGAVADLDYATTQQQIGAVTLYNPLLGSARLRAGYLISPDLLAYVTGGLAFGTTRGTAAGVDSAATSIGWTVGLGAEYMIAQNWSTYAEYRYHDLGVATINGFVGGQQTTGHTVRLGLNYRFATGGSNAVMAKY